jgi:hypothetical protein
MKTPVEWLIEQIATKESEYQAMIFYYDHQKEIEEAKQMEKDHIMMAFNDGRVSGIFKQPKTADQYYKLTYKPETI